MKRLILIFLGALVFSSASYARDVLEFNITGSIGAATCDIKNADKTVNLGFWTISDTDTSTSTAAPKWTSTMIPFTLDFDCPAGQTINVQMEGNQYDTGDIFYIGLDKTEQSASGIIIEMHYYQQKWKSVVYGETRELITNTVNGSNSVQLRAFYRQIAKPVKPGTANSTVTLTISYA
ncbi:fimbrial protein [Orbus wheelerorum]|uniref:fimbrial protein n=1 Tax=Orbus wheelerorum TaxID=3074111 RepID=UPI00370D9D19